MNRVLHFLPLVLLLAAAPVAAQKTKPASDSTRYELAEVDVLPRAINVDAFAALLGMLYPPELRDTGIEGMVEVRFLVDPAGVPHEITVVSSTEKGFDEVTARAVAALRFRPAEVRGAPVAVWVVQPVEWRIFR